jgi:FlaA1/EpsC-like NDP-sugar epimerase
MMAEGGVGRTAAAVARRAATVRSDLFFAAQDALLVVISLGCVLLVSYGGQIPSDSFGDYAKFACLAVAVYLVAHARAGLYGEIWQFASVLEARRLLLADAAALGLLLLLNLTGMRLLPPSVLVVACLFTTMLVGTVRFGSRLFSSRRREENLQGLRVVILGGGETGAALVREMLGNRRSGMIPVAILDDNPRKHGRSILGVHVVGPLDALKQVSAGLNAHQVVLAIPSAGRDLLRQVAATAHQVDVVLRVVPKSYDPVVGPLRLRDMRDLTIEDLLGRQEVSTDLAAVSRLLHGRRVLVTGAGGSIGSEIARQVASFAPAELVLLDHDETHLHDAYEGMATTPGLLNAAETTLVLADIRNDGHLSRLFALHRPDVVFHAAAHKHVPLLESHATEAALTNVMGTANVVAAAQAVAVQSFVLISTDKAVCPASVMGASKHLAEQLVLTAGKTEPGRYCAVRFGNVLGSRGSVIPTFERQIDVGGPVTVTDARMTRYFMSTREAVQLVLQAASMAHGGEVFMLEMGQPIEILELAKRMIRVSGYQVGQDIELRIIGTRPGEKLTEQLRNPDELPQGTSHPSVVRLVPSVLPRSSLDSAVAALHELCIEYDEPGVATLMMDLAHGRYGEVAPRAAPALIDLRFDELTRSVSVPTTEQM